MIIYIVKPGDTLQDIGKIYNLDYKKIAEYNGISLNETLVSGQTLIIISNSNIKKIKSIIVNGYVFPDIELSILEKTLLSLTFLSIFSYHLKIDGTLKDINDMPLIESALKNNTMPIMTLTNIGESGHFESELAHKILINNELQLKLINNILEILESKKYYGINIDFEYIFSEDKDLYIDFLNKIKSAIKDKYILNVSVAPKTNNTQKGLLYEAHDYKRIGELANYVIIMTYEWGYTKGPAMAVAPINKVEQVISYAVSEIDSQKILMGIPNYGYDWTLPFVEGSRAKSINNQEAIKIARDNNQEILFDIVSKTPFFNYYDKQSKKHEVWFEDIRSINSKLELIVKYNLAGPSYWTINRPFPQNYLFLNTLYNIKK